MTLIDLFYSLLKAKQPNEVDKILADIGDVRDMGLNVQFGASKLQWHPYGNKTSNYSSIGLASKPGRSITERITNAIDAVVEARAKTASVMPSSPQEAMKEWFGRPPSSNEAGLFSWKYNEQGNDRKVGVILHDSGIRENPTIDVVDFGIGISPRQFGETILSLQNANKISKKYLVGSFGQGGASTLAFSDYVFVVSRSIESPNTVGFTVIKEISLGEDYKENCYAYLAIKDHNGTISVPSFQLEIPLALYSAYDKLRMHELSHGTLVRHFSFKLANIHKALSPTEGNLYHYLHYSLFDPLLPFQIIDLRNPESIKQEISTGSRNRLMKLVLKPKDDEIDTSNTSLELYKPFAYITPFGASQPCVRIEYWVVYNYEKKKNSKSKEEEQVLRGDSNALYIHRKHPAVFCLNGQNQGELTMGQVTKDLGIDLVARHLVVHIDATDAPITVKRQLFTTNRESLKDGQVLDSIKLELRRILGEDEDLAALQKRLEEKEISEVTSTTDDEVKNQIVRLLREIGFTPSAEGDSVQPGQGERSQHVPGKKQVPLTPQPLSPLPTLPFPNVTKFEIVSPEETLKIQHGKTAVLKVETNADSQYNKEIKIKIEPPFLEVSSYFPLQGGRVKWRLRTTEQSRVSEIGEVIVSLTKPDGDQIRDAIAFNIIEPAQKSAKEERGFIPNFEVIPTSPDDVNWSKAWENVPDDSEECSEVAYTIKKYSNKIIVYYSTVFGPFKSQCDLLKAANNPVLSFFETNYKIWIGYHGILQFNAEGASESEGDDSAEAIKLKDRDRSLVAQMQVKQALKTSEMMLKLSKETTKHRE